MARRWSRIEENLKRRELKKLYTKNNRSIGEISKLLNLGKSTVYDRLLRLGIKPTRFKKQKFNNQRNDILIPRFNSNKLSEFIGILLGDGHLTPTQVTVTLGNKEKDYVHYIGKLIRRIFKIEPKIITRRGGYHILYFGSTKAVRWLLSMGLVFNKVKGQVDVPAWIFSKHNYLRAFLRGFFDTDGSIYKLRFGVQLGFTNRSIPMLRSIRRGLLLLGYHASNISQYRVYLTRKTDISGFFETVRPANIKHQKRYQRLMTEKVN